MQTQSTSTNHASSAQISRKNSETSPEHERTVPSSPKQLPISTPSSVQSQNSQPPLRSSGRKSYLNNKKRNIEGRSTPSNTNQNSTTSQPPPPDQGQESVPRLTAGGNPTNNLSLSQLDML